MSKYAIITLAILSLAVSSAMGETAKNEKKELTDALDKLLETSPDVDSQPPAEIKPKPTPSKKTKPKPAPKPRPKPKPAPKPKPTTMPRQKTAPKRVDLWQPKTLQAPKPVQVIKPAPADQSVRKPQPRRISIPQPTPMPQNEAGVWTPCSKAKMLAGSRLPIAKQQEVQSPRDVICVLDRSGSMVGYWLWARQDVLEAIGSLSGSDGFSLILFGTPEPVSAYPAEGFAPARASAKARADQILLEASPSGSTDIIDALARTFDVIDAAGAGLGRTRIIRLYTDGVFPNNRAVIELLRRRCAGRKVRIDTFLYGDPLPVAVGILQQIAHSHGGKFTYVTKRN